MFIYKKRLLGKAFMKQLAKSKRLDLMAELACDIANQFCSIYNNNIKKNKWERACIFCESIGLKLEKLYDNNVWKMGETDGTVVKLKDFETTLDFFVLFHEIAHAKLHVKSNMRLAKWKREVEADMFSMALCKLVMPSEADSFEEIFWTNPVTQNYLNRRDKNNG